MQTNRTKQQHLGFSTVLVILLAGMLASPAMGAAFLKIGDIKGEATDASHREWIDVLSFSHGVFQEISQFAGGTNRATKSSRADFSLVKELDKSSPLLASACCIGQEIPEVTLELASNSDPKSQPYLRIKLTRVLVSSYNLGGSDGENRPVEEITLNYEKIEWTYIQYDNKGSKISETTRSWNFATNSEK